MSTSNIAPKGFLFSSATAGIKETGSPDLALIFSATKADSAAVFTKNKVKAAPVYVSREKLKNGYCQSIIVNSGNANAATGEAGLEDAKDMCFFTAKCLNLDEDDVLVASTGVIGRRLNIQKIKTALPELCHSLKAGDVNGFAKAIMTTDKFPKVSHRVVSIKGVDVTICGIVKGAGMIMPNMATMLGFILTDAYIDHKLLGSLLIKSVDETFNRMTVDGDTSTNDMVLMMANGESGADEILDGSAEYDAFYSAARDVMYDLSVLIAKDGEGATKLIRINTLGADTEKEAVNVSRTIANSLLVKTAFFGEDANVGRLLMAIGNSDAKIFPNEIDIYINSIPIVKGSMITSRLDSKEITDALKGAEIEVNVDLNVGSARAQIVTCDLSYDYVKINADYTT